MSDPHRPRVAIQRQDLVLMIRLARQLRRLVGLPGYQAQIHQELPTTARFDPGHESVMMGYDFHMTPNGPRLIEVNTNAGGTLMAYHAQHPVFSANKDRHQERLCNIFASELGLFNKTAPIRPAFIVILDEEPEKQFLYPEMVAFETLFKQWGSQVVIVAPEALTMGQEGVFYQGNRVDLIYNRHCDFYLESKPLIGLAQAWLNRQICLTPNPRQYGLLADKRRMILWSDPAFLAEMNLDPRERDLILQSVPITRLLATQDQNRVWTDRNQWVFKPCIGFGSRGVLLGNKISRTRFNTLDNHLTLIQQAIPPSSTFVDGQEMKTDIRLFFYRDQPLGVAARVYRGQVTNFAMTGNGFMPVQIR